MYKVVARNGMREVPPRIFVEYEDAAWYYNQCVTGAQGVTWVGLYAQGIMQKHERVVENDSHLTQTMNDNNGETS
jgi:hypothetical protein